MIDEKKIFSIVEIDIPAAVDLSREMIDVYNLFFKGAKISKAKALYTSFQAVAFFLNHLLADIVGHKTLDEDPEQEILYAGMMCFLNETVVQVASEYDKSLKRQKEKEKHTH